MLRTIALLGFFFVAAQAGATNLTTTCPPLTVFQAYIDLGSTGCRVGDIQDSLFAFSATATGVTPLTADQLSFQPVPVNEGLYSQVGLTIVGPSDGSVFSEQIVVGWLQTGLPGIVINSIGVDFMGDAQHFGLASVTEDYCIGQNTITGCPAGSGGEVVLSTATSVFNSMIQISGAASVFVQYTLNVSSGSQGDGHLLEFETNNTTGPGFTGPGSGNVPEASTALLCGLGLVFFKTRLYLLR